METNRNDNTDEIQDTYCEDKDRLLEDIKNNTLKVGAERKEPYSIAEVFYWADVLKMKCDTVADFEAVIAVLDMKGSVYNSVNVVGYTAEQLREKARILEQHQAEQEQRRKAVEDDIKQLHERIVEATDPKAIEAKREKTRKYNSNKTKKRKDERKNELITVTPQFLQSTLKPQFEIERSIMQSVKAEETVIGYTDSQTAEQITRTIKREHIERALMLICEITKTASYTAQQFVTIDLRESEFNAHVAKLYGERTNLSRDLLDNMKFALYFWNSKRYGIPNPLNKNRPIVNSLITIQEHIDGKMKLTVWCVPFWGQLTGTSQLKAMLKPINTLTDGNFSKDRLKRIIATKLQRTEDELIKEVFALDEHDPVEVRKHWSYYRAQLERYFKELKQEGVIKSFNKSVNKSEKTVYKWQN